VKRYIFDADTETMMESLDGEYVLYTDAVKAQREAYVEGWGAGVDGDAEDEDDAKRIAARRYKEE